VEHLATRPAARANIDLLRGRWLLKRRCSCKDSYVWLIDVHTKLQRSTLQTGVPGVLFKLAFKRPKIDLFFKFARLGNYRRIVSFPQLNFDEMRCKLDSTENPRSFENTQHMLARLRVSLPKSTAVTSSCRWLSSSSASDAPPALPKLHYFAFRGTCGTHPIPSTHINGNEHA